MTDSLVQKLENRELLMGSIMTLASPEIAEIFAGIGYDWLWVDVEHSTLTVQDVQRIVQATHGKCHCVVRAPSTDEVWIKKLMDTGVDGILFPHVNSGAEAERIVRKCKYPPEGTRSVGISRAHGYGLTFQEYVDRANREVAIVLQIEDIEAVKNVDSIVQVQGVDAIMIGPYDLSGTMGKPGKVSDDDVQREIEKVRQACEVADLPIGIFGIDPRAVKPHIGRGFTLIGMGFDTTFLIKAAKEALGEIRGEINV